MRSARPQRHSRLVRLAPLAVAASLLVAACGDAQEEEGSSATTAAEATGTTDATGATDGAADTEATDAPQPTVAANVPPKPEVEIPTGEVTELTITDLSDGTGAEAADGDTVVVHYVGVRSEDGTEFDNSYDRGQPFSVTLGAGMVIAGWDQGLVGVKQGGQRQLDIPTDLAYGDSPQGDVIQPGDALTFVVDVVAVIPKSDPADAPTVEVEAGTTVDSLAIEDLEAGEGDEVETGQTVAFDYIFIRTDTGEQLESSWETGSPQTLPFDEAQLPPVLFDAFAGVKVGTVRKVSIPFAEASELFQLPGDTDIVLVIRVNAIY
jgi:peptidylprolyl isomerase